MFKHIFQKSCQQSYLPLNIPCTKNFSINLNTPTSCGNRLNFIQINCDPIIWTQKILISHTTVTLNEGQSHPKSLVVSIHTPSLKEICVCLNTSWGWIFIKQKNLLYKMACWTAGRTDNGQLAEYNRSHRSMLLIQIKNRTFYMSQIDSAKQNHIIVFVSAQCRSRGTFIRGF